MHRVLHVQIVLFKLQDCLLLKICYGKFCFVNYWYKIGLSENKRTTSVTRTIKYSLDYTAMVSFFLLRYTLFL